jgi:hypothetical protein
MRRAAAIVLILFSAGALAHPGHGVVDLWHLLTEPDHLALLLLPLVVAIKWGQSLFKRRRQKQKVRSPFRE